MVGYFLVRKGHIAGLQNEKSSVKPKLGLLFLALFVIAGTILVLHKATTSDGMVMIPAGSFTMGDTLDGWRDAIPTNVTLPAFYMDVNLVTLSQWQSVNKWATNHGYSVDNAGSGNGTNHPVMGPCWYDCIKWCDARSNDRTSPAPVVCQFLQLRRLALRE